MVGFLFLIFSPKRVPTFIIFLNKIFLRFHIFLCSPFYKVVYFSTVWEKKCIHLRFPNLSIFPPRMASLSPGVATLGRKRTKVGSGYRQNGSGMRENISSRGRTSRRRRGTSSAIQFQGKWSVKLNEKRSKRKEPKHDWDYHCPPGFHGCMASLRGFVKPLPP